MRVNDQVLSGFVTNIFTALGVSKEEAATMAEVLVEADCRGIYSHGMERVPEYADRIKKGGWSTKTEITVEKEAGAVALINGNNGIGIITAMAAMKKAIELARTNGVGLVSVKGGGHFATAAYFAMMAQKEDMIGICLTNASPSMAPTGGADPIIGNNPWSVAIPGSKTDGIVLDMANSTVARGKIRYAAKNNQPIPLGWAIDKDGLPTTDAEVALKGSLAPIGGYKGYGITLVVDFLAGILSGAAYGPHVGSPRAPEQKQNAGHLFLAINVAMLQPAEAFKDRVDTYISEIKNSRLADGTPEIFVPGEMEFRTERKYRQEGLEISGSTMKALLKVAQEAGVTPPEEFTKSV